MKYIYLLLLICCTPVYVDAQYSNFKKAFIITNNDEKVDGFADFRIDEMNAQHCMFKKDESSNIEDFTPEQIKEYHFPSEKKYYISHDVKIDSVNHKLFLEFLVEGEMNLYYTVYDNQKYYFFEDNMGNMTAITQKPSKVENYKTINDIRYKGILRYTFQNYPEIKEEIDKTKYFSQKEMIDIAKMYHEKTCTTGEKCIVYQSQSADAIYLKFDISVYGGIQFINYSFDKNFPVSLDSKSYTSPLIGAKLFISNARWSNKFSYGVDVSFSKMKISESVKPSANESDNFSTYDPIIIGVKIGAKYTHLKGKIRPTVEAGIANSIFTKDNFIYFENVESGTGEVSAFKKNIKMPSYFIGPYVAIGFNYPIGKHSLFVNGGYELGYPAQSIKQSKNKIQSPFIKVGFTL